MTSFCPAELLPVFDFPIEMLLSAASIAWPVRDLKERD